MLWAWIALVVGLVLLADEVQQQVGIGREWREMQRRMP